MTRHKKYFFFLALTMLLPSGIVKAQDSTPQKQTCAIGNRACILSDLEKTADQIENKAWRDQTYRELSKTLAFEGNIDQSIIVLNKIENPDTKALTIRGIGMAVAEHPDSVDNHVKLFARLRTEADKIDHPPSYAIAQTYIAMSQAFAGDNEGAWATAASMENDALRHKAYGETAEIQAEKGDFASAFKSIAFIESEAFRNKAYSVVGKILADGKYYEAAYNAAHSITNPYKKADIIQYVLDQQKPREAEK